MAARRPTNARDRRVKVEQERARVHAARSRWHEGVNARRVRDNVIAAIAGSVIVVGAIVSQAVHAQVTAPAPSPSPTAVPTVMPSEIPGGPDTTPMPGATDAPVPSPSATP
ncbi:hypothetical protein J2Y69_003181 [Microbacterium resistens]|uniref:Dioxygenase n=1 Tax=Microbacterium resistens TaxID=156977 RepID=A0ABU1SG81_9MICO|nr:hypothetical protein [Microbacterium resistens]MDR6868562.1 hypothetical protein [Microbacterium resistens]